MRIVNRITLGILSLFAQMTSSMKFFIVLVHKEVIDESCEILKMIIQSFFMIFLLQSLDVVELATDQSLDRYRTERLKDIVELNID